MKPAAFRYHAPKTLDEAVAVLAEVAPDDGRVLAGGQSLVPIMAFRLAKPAHLVDINGVEELAQHHGRRRQAADRRLRAPRGVLRAGVRRAAGQAARDRRAPASRIIRSAPAAPSAAAWRTPTRPRNGARSSATLDAEMVAQSKRGTRIIAAKDYFDGHHDHGARRGRTADRGAAADCCRPTRASASRSSPAAPATSRSSMAVVTYRVDERQDRRRARRHRRRRAVSAPHRRSRSRAQRQVARTGGVPGRGRGGRRGDRPA